MNERKYMVEPGDKIRCSRRIIILSCKPGPRTKQQIVEDTNLSYGGPVLRYEDGEIKVNLNPDKPELYIVPCLKEAKDG